MTGLDFRAFEEDSFEDFLVDDFISSIATLSSPSASSKHAIKRFRSNSEKK